MENDTKNGESVFVLLAILVLAALLFISNAQPNTHICLSDRYCGAPGCHN